MPETLVNENHDSKDIVKDGVLVWPGSDIEVNATDQRRTAGDLEAEQLSEAAFSKIEAVGTTATEHAVEIDDQSSEAEEVRVDAA